MVYEIKYPVCPKCGSDDVDLRIMDDSLHFEAFCMICGYCGSPRRYEGEAFRSFMNET